MPAALPLPPAARAELAGQLRRLWPDRPAAVAMARVDRLPTGVSLRSGPATSACLFWREAERGVFAVGAEHGSCPIGRITQGFTTELPTADELVGTMVETGYVDPAEVAAMPALPLGHTAIVYGPLADLPVDPEAVLLVGLPEQVMLLGEALGAARLDGTGLTVMGRPTCAAVAASILRDQPRGSLACVGARIFAGFEPGELLMVLPGTMLGRLAAALERTVIANQRVGALDLELKRCLAETA
ncbi:MAG TPA: DUF169 domain-containing protein [Candidatus Dormibacteraeota bacterium]|jgi:uncharacterized protein (DUF169 family)|nr:DUF169 domain-containing protein [Candidatus Dormibacteraeota bacterium]